MTLSLKEALLALAEGKKLTRYGWEIDEYIHLCGNSIGTGKGTGVAYMPGDDGWELYQEPKKMRKIVFKAWFCRYELEWATDRDMAPNWKPALNADGTQMTMEIYIEDDK